MSKIVGYGEDALTLRALTKHLSVILKHPKFNDATPVEDCLPRGKNSHVHE